MLMSHVPTSFRYQEPKLEKLARAEFTKRAGAIEDVRVICDIVVAARSDAAHDALTRSVDELENRHLAALVKEPEYRKMLEEDTSLLWNQLERLTFAASLEELIIGHCPSCDARPLWKKGASASVECVRCRTRYQYYTCWVKREDVPRIMDQSKRNR